MAGCSNSSWMVRGEYAPATSFAIAKVINDNHASHTMQGHYVSVRGGLRFDLNEEFELDLDVGPSGFFREGGEGQYFGAETAPRLVYSGLNLPVNFYLESLFGVGYLPQKWVGEATNFQFSLGGGVGISIPIDKHWEIDLGYRLYHISNGSGIFGSPRPNVGYNTDFVLFGLSYHF